MALYGLAAAAAPIAVVLSALILAQSKRLASVWVSTGAAFLDVVVIVTAIAVRLPVLGCLLLALVGPTAGYWLGGHLERRDAGAVHPGCGSSEFALLTGAVWILG